MGERERAIVPSAPFETTEANATLFSSLANRGGSVRLASNRRIDPKNVGGPASCGNAERRGRHQDLRPLATPAGVGERLPHEDMGPGTDEIDETPQVDAGPEPAQRDAQRGPGADATTNEIRLDLNRRLAAAEEKRFTLYVCDTPLRFADATYSSSGHRYTWDNASDRVDLHKHGVRTLYVSDAYDVVESSGNDFSHDADTTAIVSVGTVSRGRLSYPEDGDPWADVGDPGWGDMFRLVGLEPRKTYRVEVDFTRVANTVGGSIQMYICCNHGPDPYAVSEWDSNYDGRAIFDFDTGWTVGATFVSVIPSNSMKPNGWEFGELHRHPDRRHGPQEAGQQHQTAADDREVYISREGHLRTCNRQGPARHVLHDGR